MEGFMTSIGSASIGESRMLVGKVGVEGDRYIESGNKPALQRAGL